MVLTFFLMGITPSKILMRKVEKKKKTLNDWFPNSRSKNKTFTKQNNIVFVLKRSHLFIFRGKKKGKKNVRRMKQQEI